MDDIDIETLDKIIEKERQTLAHIQEGDEEEAMKSLNSMMQTIREGINK
jgi:hypothetical protein